MKTSETVMEGLRSLLIYTNVAVLCLGIGFAPERGSWSAPIYYNDPLSIWWVSHQTGYLFWLVLASVLISIGIYRFVALFCPEMQRVEEQLPSSTYPHFESPPEA